jgi:hypothetical protein
MVLALTCLTLLKVQLAVGGLLNLPIGVTYEQRDVWSAPLFVGAPR